MTAGAPIDQAYVEITADLDRLVTQLRTGLDSAFAAVGRQADQTGEGIERAFAEAGTGAAADMRDLEATTARVGEGIERDFAEAGRGATDSLDRIGGPGTFAAVGDQAQRAGERVEGAFAEANRGSTADLRGIGGPGTFLPVTAAADRAADAIEHDFRRAGISAAASLGGIRVAALGMVAALVLGVAGGLAALTGFGLMSAAQLEQTQVAFNSLTGSVEAGARTLKELQTFAAATPFEFPEIATAAQRFLAFNTSVGLADADLQRFLTDVGNVASVTGGGAQALTSVSIAMGQIGSSGKVTLENLNQISEAMPGFSGVAAIAAAEGMTTAEAMEAISAGEISATEGIADLLEGMEKFPGATGAMEAQSKTLLGVFSTFVDVAKLTINEAFLPLIPLVKDTLAELTPAVADALGVLAPAIVDLLEPLQPILLQLVGALGPVLASVLEALAGGFEMLGPVLGPVGAAITGLVVAVSPLLPVVGQLIATLLPPLAQLLGSVAGAAAPLILLMADFATQLLNELVPVLPQIVDSLAEIARVIADQLMAILPEQIAAWLELTIALLPLLPVLVQLITLVLQLAAGPLGVLLLATTKMTTALVTFTTAILGPVIGAVNAVAGWLTTLVGRAATTGQQVSRLSDTFTNAWAIIRREVSNAVAGIQGVLAWFGGLGGRFAGWFGAARTAAASALGSLVSTVGGIPGRIVGALGDLGGLLYSAGRNVIGGLIRGVTSRIGELAATISRAAATIRNHLPFSPAREGPLSGAGNPELAGQAIPRMLAAGIRSTAGAVGDAMGAMLQQVSPTAPTVNVGVAGRPAPAGVVDGVRAAGQGGTQIGQVIVHAQNDRFRLSDVIEDLTFRQRQLHLQGVS